LCLPKLLRVSVYGPTASDGRLIEDLQESPPQMPSRYFEDGRQAFGTLVNAHGHLPNIKSHPGTPDLVLDLFRVPCRVFNMTGLGSAIFHIYIYYYYYYYYYYHYYHYYYIILMVNLYFC